MSDTEGRVTAQARYATLEAERQTFVTLAEQASEFTVPSLFPKGQSKPGAKLPTLYQSIGARGVNNLAAKLLLALIPPGAAFFKLTVDPFVLDQLAGAKSDDPSQDPKALIDDALAKMERSVMTRFEQSGSRSILFGTLKHLIVTGNYLLEVLPTGKLKGHSLRNFVVKRDLEGTLLEVIVKETVSRDALPKDFRAALDADENAPKDESGQPCAEVDVYTRLYLEDGKWAGCQEIEGHIVPDTEQTYPKDRLPFLPLRFVTVAGEDYGRGYVEEYLGDLTSLESLRASIVDFAAIAAKILFLVDDGGLTRKKDLQDAPNGAIRDGKASDVSILALEKYNDFSVAKAVHDDIKTSLEQAFLLTSSIQRQAERVTAEEIRVMAGELEQTLGGIYSVLAQELQLPLVTLYMAQLERSGDLPKLPKDTVAPAIVTGLEGLGRATEAQRLLTFTSDLGQTFGPEAVAQYIHVGNYAKRLGTALGVETDGIVRSDDEVQQQVQQEQRAQLAQTVIPQGMQHGADMAMAQQQAQQTQAA